MPRTKRNLIDGQEYHYTLRGNNQRIIFYTNQDKFIYLRQLRRFSDKYKIEIHAFALMSNHIHVHLTCRHESHRTIPLWAKSTAQCFSMYKNKHHETSGKLFEQRYACAPIKDKVHSLNTKIYIESNPLRQTIPCPEDIGRWTSYGCWAPSNIQLFPCCGETHLRKKLLQFPKRYKPLFDQRVEHWVQENAYETEPQYIPIRPNGRDAR